MAAHPLALAQLPYQSGLYRLRSTSYPDRLVYAGYAEQGIRELVERLSRQVHLPVRPYDDPRGPALHLWVLRRQHGKHFEVSGAAMHATREELEELCRPWSLDLESR